MYHAQTHPTRQRLATLIAVGAIECGLGAALLSAFAGGSVTRAIDRALQAQAFYPAAPLPRPQRAHAAARGETARTAPHSAEPGLAPLAPFVLAQSDLGSALAAGLDDIALAPPKFAPAGPALAARPLGDPGQWITTDDYPSRALREGWSGLTRLHLEIDALGMVVACQVVQSSGHAELDAVACDRVSRRARFAPARDPDGNARAGRFDGAIRWQIQDTGRE